MGNAHGVYFETGVWAVGLVSRRVGSCSDLDLFGWRAYPFVLLLLYPTRGSSKRKMSGREDVIVIAHNERGHWEVSMAKCFPVALAAT